MIDTHAHIYLQQFKQDLQDAISRSKDLGVDHIFMPNIDQTSIDDMMEVEERYNGYCTPMMGLHPCSVKKGFEQQLYLVESWLEKRKFAAIGEIGTDLYWDKSTFELQEEAFKIQVNWANDRKIPIVIHCRESLDETLDILEPLIRSDSKGIFHCFTGSHAQAERITTFGFKLGIGGVLTFKNAGLDNTIKDIGPEHLVLETDSPYLAPVPYRGKRNEPAYLPLILNRLAEVYEMSVSDLDKLTTSNAMEVFGISL